VDVGADESGQFVVAWQHSTGYDYDDAIYLYGEHIRTRRYDGAGNALGPEMVASTHWTSSLDKDVPAIATRTPGKFIVAWQSSRQDGSGFGVYARSPDVLFVDAFEAGLSTWTTAATDGGDLTLSSAARMAGSPSTGFGLQVLVDDQAGLFVQDDTPADEPLYRARFYLDPNGYDPGEALGQFRQHVFIAFASSPQKRLVLLILRRVAGAYSIAAHVRRDDDTLAMTPFVPIADGPNAIEIAWQRASGPIAIDGHLELWVNGASAATLTGLDNDERGVDFVRMGAMSVRPGATGTLFFDEFVSRRLAYIGP